MSSTLSYKHFGNAQTLKNAQPTWYSNYPISVSIFLKLELQRSSVRRDSLSCLTIIVPPFQFQTFSKCDAATLNNDKQRKNIHESTTYHITAHLRPKSPSQPVTKCLTDTLLSRIVIMEKKGQMLMMTTSHLYLHPQRQAERKSYFALRFVSNWIGLGSYQFSPHIQSFS